MGMGVEASLVAKTRRSTPMPGLSSQRTLLHHSDRDMEKQQPVVRLDDLFFPVQHVAALPNHEPGGERAGTDFQLSHEIERVENDEGKEFLAVKVRVKNNSEKSVNAPYDFDVEAYAVLHIDNWTGNVKERRVAETVGLQIVVGAIRERLADLTSRAPWGRFLLNAMAVKAIVKNGEEAPEQVPETNPES